MDMNSLKAIESDIITFTKANFHNVCRVCFCENNPPLFNIFSSQFKEESIIDLINICMPKQAIDISVPNNICKDCLNHLSRFKTFINQFKYADTLLTFVKDQLNNGREEVKINNFSNPVVKTPLKDIKKTHGSSNSPSTIVFEQNNATGNTNKKSGILRKLKPTVNALSNLNKTKSKSSEHISFPDTKNKPLLSLPLLITCIICKIDFLNLKIYETHMRNNHLSKILKCSLCTSMKEFFNAEELKRHKITSHELIECRICKSLVAAINIDKHNEKRHPANAFADNNSNDEEDQCKLHIIKIENLNKSFASSTKCDKCSNIFKNDELYMEHLVLCKQPVTVPITNIKYQQVPITAPSTKPITNKTMICVLCKDKTFPSYTHFEQHCSKQHRDTICCNICQANILYSKEAFKLHKLNAHGFVTCHICQCIIKPERIQKHMDDCHNIYILERKNRN